MCIIGKEEFCYLEITLLTYLLWSMVTWIYRTCQLCSVQRGLQCGHLRLCWRYGARLGLPKPTSWTRSGFHNSLHLITSLISHWSHVIQYQWWLSRSAVDDNYVKFCECVKRPPRGWRARWSHLYLGGGGKNSRWHNAWSTEQCNVTPTMRCHAVNTAIM